MKKYTIELTEEQLEGLAYACRITDRLILGQLDFSLQECCEQAWRKRQKEKGVENPNFTLEREAMRQLVEEHINQLRLLCWGQRRGTMNGIHYDEYADMLFDMQKVMEHALWLERPDNENSHITNDAFEPMQFGGEPLINVKPCE